MVITKIVACWRLVIAVTSFILMYLSYLLGDKESKRKQKSPGTAAAAQVVVMRELKWDHQVCTINFMISAHLAQGHLAPICRVQRKSVLQPAIRAS